MPDMPLPSEPTPARENTLDRILRESLEEAAGIRRSSGRPTRVRVRSVPDDSLMIATPMSEEQYVGISSGEERAPEESLLQGPGTYWSDSNPLHSWSVDRYTRYTDRVGTVQTELPEDDAPLSSIRYDDSQVRYNLVLESIRRDFEAGNRGRAEEDYNQYLNTTTPFGRRARDMGTEFRKLEVDWYVKRYLESGFLNPDGTENNAPGVMSFSQGAVIHELQSAFTRTYDVNLHELAREVLRERVLAERMADVERMFNSPSGGMTEEVERYCQSQGSDNCAVRRSQRMLEFRTSLVRPAEQFRYRQSAASEQLDIARIFELAYDEPLFPLENPTREAEDITMPSRPRSAYSVLNTMPRRTSRPQPAPSFEEYTGLLSTTSTTKRPSKKGKCFECRKGWNILNQLKLNMLPDEKAYCDACVQKHWVSCHNCGAGTKKEYAKALSRNNWECTRCFHSSRSIRFNKSKLYTKTDGISRHFGVEVEAYHCGNKRIFPRVHMRAKTDGSIRCRQHNQSQCGVEYNFGALNGNEGMDIIKTALRDMRLNKHGVNKSCGLHVHVDAKDLTVRDLTCIGSFWYRYQEVIFSFLAKSRASNSYCVKWGPQALKDLKACHGAWSAQAYRKDGVKPSYVGPADPFFLEQYFRNYQRYTACNFHAYKAHHTIEFRCHQGTLAYDKVSAWVNLCLKIVERGQQSFWSRPTFKTLDQATEEFFNMLELNKKQREYWLERQAILKKEGVTM